MQKKFSTKPQPHIRLFSLLKAEHADLSIIVTFSVVTGLLYLATPLAVDAVVQNIAFGGQQQVYVQTLLVFSFALLVFLLLLSMVSAAQHFIAELVQQRIFVRISTDLAYRLPRLNLRDKEQSKPQELINRFLDVTTLQKSSALILLDGVNVVLSSGIGMLVLAFYHPFLLAFDFVLVVCLLFVLFVLGKKGAESSIRESYAKHTLAGWLEQIILFPLIFKMPTGQKLALSKASALVDNYLASRKSHYRILLRQILGLLSIQAFASAGLLAVGGWLVLNGELTLGQLVASELIVSAIVSALVSLGKHIEIWYDALAATDKLGSLVDLQIERQSGERNTPPNSAVEVNLAEIQFSHQKTVFDDFSLHISPGEAVGLTGAPGAGTTTLFEILYGLRQVESGAVLLDGTELKQWNLSAIRSATTLLHQPEAFEGTIAENLRLEDDSLKTDRLRTILDQVGLLTRIQKLPRGIETVIEAGGLPLTESELRLLTLARALASDPKLILVDKLLDGMSEKTFDRAIDLLFHKDRAWTLIISTQASHLLERCDRIVRL